VIYLVSFLARPQVANVAPTLAVRCQAPDGLD
jgi:hypothetical protein